MGFYRCVCVCVCVCVCLVTQVYLSLWDLMDCSLPSSSVHGILQARILEWVAIPFTRESSQTRNRTQVSQIVGGFFTVWATRERRFLQPPPQDTVPAFQRIPMCCIFVFRSSLYTFSWQLLIFFSVSFFFFSFFRMSYKWNQAVIFWDWILSLSQMHLRFIQVGVS